MTVAQGTIKLLQFAAMHSLRDMGRNRTRTMFALVCVATGVAAVVALRTLAFMVGDELTTNLAQINRGDLRVFASRGVPELVTQSSGETVFTGETVRLIREWASYEGVTLSLARIPYLAQIKAAGGDSGSRSMPGMLLFVEPETYPFYDSITMVEPAGVSLGAALSARAPGQTPIVISPGLSRDETLGLEVGDQVQIGAAEATFVVTGISEPDAESILTLPPTAFFDYAYLPLNALHLLGEDVLPDQVFIKVPLGRDIAQVEASLIGYLQNAVGPDFDVAKELNRASVPELEKQNAEAAGVIDDMILVMGLSALLIGGIGIVNTMLVVVSRRTLEIAVLKTLGLKAYRVTLLFLVEALLLGMIGSAVGVVLGVVLSYLIRDVGETAFKLTLDWRFYPEAATSGIFLGLVVTGLFGFLPTLIAGQVRPAIVLRPNEAQMPSAGLLQVLGTVGVMIVVLGLLVDSIVEGAIDYGPVYMLAGGGALIGLFAGVILTNTGLGSPIPPGYRFSLRRRFERLENVLLDTAGWLSAWLPNAVWSSESRRERGREAITAGLRAVRQATLLYGALAIGAALASAILLISSELWRPFGLGAREPANDVYYAVRNGDWAWVGAWVLLTSMIALIVRRAGRALAGLIALGTLGITFGGLLGWLLGRVLEATIYGTGVWAALAEISTGVVLVEAALAVLCVVYAGYWLLVWGLARLSPAVLLGLASLVLVSLAMGVIAVVGRGAVLWILIGVALALSLILAIRPVRQRQPGERPDTESWKSRPGSKRGLVPQVAFGVGVLGAGVLLSQSFGAWPLVIVVGAISVVLWRRLTRSYRTEGQLILREMNGRRSRVASTLLGLSVGIAGLSLVSLTADAVSHLLRLQIDQTAEGNLLVVGTRPENSAEVATALSADPGVERFTQFMTYSGVLLSINGVEVEAFDPHQALSEEEDPRENGMFERTERGIWTALSERQDLQLPDYQMKAGRRLGPQDVGQHHLMLRESFLQERYNIQVGDRLMFLFENAPGEADDVLIQLTVVGIISRQSEQTGLEDAGNLFSVPPGTLSSQGVRPSSAVAIAQVDETDPTAMARVKDSVTDVPGVLAFDLRAVTQLLENLINQLRAIPALVAWLALLAGTAIIANTVALATQERRRQIGVMKAVGLKGRRVLGMLIAEFGLVGFVAGVIGVGVGFLTTVILVLASRNPEELNQAIEYPTMGWLLLMSVAVAMGAALFSAWTAAAEKPMDVLRYE